MTQFNSPFDLEDHESYLIWRDAKLASFPDRVEDVVVEINDPLDMTAVEVQAITERCAQANMAIYAGPESPNLNGEGVRRLGLQFGLKNLDHNMLADEDAITPLTVAQGTRAKYIPYTDRPLGWHTDGYYNKPTEQIQGMILHCVARAEDGGGNGLLDPEMVYMGLRDEDPALVRALMFDDAMTIPGNAEEGFAPRPDRVGPVFTVAVNGRLHMRYTERSRNITWKDDDDVRAAVLFINNFTKINLKCVWHHILEPGQGLICSNVLHSRAAFRDGHDHKRLMFRARYQDHITGMGSVLEAGNIDGSNFGHKIDEW